MNDHQSDLIKYVPPKCEKCGCEIVNLNLMCVPCAVNQRMRTALQEIANTVNYAQWYQETAEKALEDANHTEVALDKVAAAAINEQLCTALEGLLAITRESQGVVGYHLNGVVAYWDKFEEVSAAEAAIAAADAEKAKGVCDA